jgi:amidase
MTDLASLDATAQAELVRTKEITPKELIEGAIERIERLNPTLNAVIHERFDKALDEADRVDGDAPFAGVPYLAKDGNCATAGDPYHVGLPPLKAAGFRATDDSILAERFRDAGFVCVGRTNVPQLLLSATTEPTAYGPTRNPWDTDRSSGGSSGGSGSAVASGMVAVGHGNDAGGSIRIPAAMCGLVGLKPTRARVSDGPLLGVTWGGLNHEFALTRSIRDTAALLDALGRRAWGDPYTAPPAVRPWSAEVGAPLARLRVRVVGGVSHMATDREVAAAVDVTAALLSDLGHDVEAAAVPELEEDAHWGEVIAVSAARDVERLADAAGISIEPGDLEPLNAMIVARGREVSAAQYQAALERMHAYSRRLEARWADFDVLLTPMCPVQQARIGEMAPDADLATMGAALAARTVFTSPFNVTGQPAISLPLHQTAAGLPIGIQLVAVTGREDLLLRMASQLETVLPWANRRPPVFAA